MQVWFRSSDNRVLISKSNESQYTIRILAFVWFSSTRGSEASRPPDRGCIPCIISYFNIPANEAICTLQCVVSLITQWLFSMCRFRWRCMLLARAVHIKIQHCNVSLWNNLLVAIQYERRDIYFLSEHYIAFALINLRNFTNRWQSQLVHLIKSANSSFHFFKYFPCSIHHITNIRLFHRRIQG